MSPTDHRSNPATSNDAPGAPLVTGVVATPWGLLRATAGAAAAAAVILTLFWLPAEYGIDPTGVGRVLGLTPMGQIKQQLYAEAKADDAAPIPPADVDPAVLQRLDAIETQLAAMAAALGAGPAPASGAGVPEAGATWAATVSASSAATATAPTWRDEVSYTLAPGEGVEVKLLMQAGAVARFQWTANGAVLNYDTHGHGSGQRVTYERGRAVAEQQAELLAAFSGQHGWFWRNRTAAPVTLTLRTGGDYAELRAP